MRFDDARRTVVGVPRRAGFTLLEVMFTLALAATLAVITAIALTDGEETVEEAGDAYVDGYLGGSRSDLIDGGLVSSGS